MTATYERPCEHEKYEYFMNSTRRCCLSCGKWEKYNHSKNKWEDE